MEPKMELHREDANEGRKRIWTTVSRFDASKYLREHLGWALVEPKMRAGNCAKIVENVVKNLIIF